MSNSYRIIIKESKINFTKKVFNYIAVNSVDRNSKTNSIVIQDLGYIIITLNSVELNRIKGDYNLIEYIKEIEKCENEN